MINNEFLNELKGSCLINGDCISELSKMDSNIFDSCVIDPPYGINFLNKKWDNFSDASVLDKIDSVNNDAVKSLSAVGQESLNFYKWSLLWSTELKRVLKPGGYALVFASTKMYHWVAVALESCGFEIKDTLSWNYINGFPKSRNIKVEDNSNTYVFETGLKPGMELICLAQKPVSEKTIKANIERWKTGGLNIESCRIGEDRRWPVNVLVDEQTAITLDLQYQKNISRMFFCPKPNNKEKNAGLFDLPKVRRDIDKDGNHRVMSKKSVLPQHNPHPTIKPIELLGYLCKLITPPNGTVVDCFMGSGSCGIAARLANFKYVGIEIDNEYCQIAAKRIEYFLKNQKAA